MNVCMTIVRPGLFFQREGPGSEPGNSLLCPDETVYAVSRRKQHKQTRTNAGNQRAARQRIAAEKSPRRGE